MKKRNVCIIFIIVFMVLLIVPLVSVDKNGGKVSEKENRTLAARPPLSLLVEAPTQFIEELDAWFSDNLGFREEMIQSYDKLNDIENEEGIRYIGYYTYLIGEDGHEFFDEEGKLISKFQGNPYLTEEQLSGMAAGLNEIKKYLDEKNIPMIVMLGTDKETIYPEYYPKSIMPGPEPVQLDVITKYLQDNTGIDVFNIRQALFDQKENYLLYDKTVIVQGTDVVHYNEIGAFFAYQEMIRHINKYLPGVEPLTIDDIDITYDENGSPITTVKQGESYEYVDGAFLGELEEPSDDMWRIQQFENANKDLPNILLMGDSNINLKTIRDGKAELKYMDALPEHFTKTGLIHYEYLDHFKEFVEYYEPDIVVFEAAERQLDLFAAQISAYQNN